MSKILRLDETKGKKKLSCCTGHPESARKKADLRVSIRCGLCTRTRQSLKIKEPVSFPKGKAEL